MFNRRFLRIKVFQQLYAFSKDVKAVLSAYEKNLIHSLEKADELYLYLLTIPVGMRTYALAELEAEKTKFYPNQKRILWLEKLVNNKAILKLENNEFLNKHVKANAPKDMSNSEFYRIVFQELKDNEYINSLDSQASTTFAEQKQLVGELLQIVIGESELFNATIEEQFRNWEDDQVTATTLLLKSLEKMKDNNSDDFISRPESDNEDLHFIKELLRKVIEKDEELTAYIASKTQNWDPDRIAETDMILMKLALCEILYFPYIPVKVSINEYLELAKLYSTPNSHGFINGILDKIQISLRSENKIEKAGRGLVE